MTTYLVQTMWGDGTQWFTLWVTRSEGFALARANFILDNDPEVSSVRVVRSVNEQTTIYGPVERS